MTERSVLKSKNYERQQKKRGDWISFSKLVTKSGQLKELQLNQTGWNSNIAASETGDWR